MMHRYLPVPPGASTAKLWFPEGEDPYIEVKWFFWTKRRAPEPIDLTTIGQAVAMMLKRPVAFRIPTVDQAEHGTPDTWIRRWAVDLGEKPKRGPKPKPEAERKKHRVRVYLDDIELAVLEKLRGKTERSAYFASLLAAEQARKKT